MHTRTSGRPLRPATLIGVAAIGAACLAAVTQPASAQEKYPARPIEVIVPTPPGGGTDIAFRLLAEIAEPMLGQKLVVVNKAGGGGMIGMAQVVSARPDGYTLGGLWNAPLTMTPHMQQAPYSPADYVTISMADSAPMVLCTKQEFPAKDAREFIEHVRKNPGKFTYGNDGVGGTIQLSVERVFTKLGIKARPVPFGGAGETLKNFIGGHVDIYAGSIPPIVPYVKDASAKCLMLTGPDRNASLPQAASLADLGMSENSTALWHGMVGPKGIPADRLALLEKTFMQAAKTERFRQFMEPKGIKVEGTSGAEFRKVIDSEYAAMGQVMKAIGLTK
jgi:tripartite-type tricarboxylate transporter receptor subunit TctC